MIPEQTRTNDEDNNNDSDVDEDEWTNFSIELWNKLVDSPFCNFPKSKNHMLYSFELLYKQNFKKKLCN